MKNQTLPLLTLLALTAPAFAQTPPSPLPIKQVTVFTSGVSYIERDGTVTKVSAEQSVSVHGPLKLQ